MAVELYLQGLSYRQVGRILAHNSVGGSSKTRRIRLHAENSRSKETLIKSLENGDTSRWQLTLKAGGYPPSGLQSLGTGGLPEILFWWFLKSCDNTSVFLVDGG